MRLGEGDAVLSNFSLLALFVPLFPLSPPPAFSYPLSNLYQKPPPEPEGVARSFAASGGWTPPKAERGVVRYFRPNTRPTSPLPSTFAPFVTVPPTFLPTLTARSARDSLDWVEPPAGGSMRDSGASGRLGM